MKIKKVLLSFVLLVLCSVALRTFAQSKSFAESSAGLKTAAMDAIVAQASTPYKMSESWERQPIRQLANHDVQGTYLPNDFYSPVVIPASALTAPRIGSQRGSFGNPVHVSLNSYGSPGGTSYLSSTMRTIYRSSLRAR